MPLFASATREKRRRSGRQRRSRGKRRREGCAPNDPNVLHTFLTLIKLTRREVSRNLKPVPC